MKAGAALITGAARRIGRAIALDLAAAGWDVAIHCHGSREEALATAADARAAGAARAAALPADLLVEAEASTLTARAAEALGRPLTLLVNNASIFEHDRIDTATRCSWDRHMESNLRAPFVLTQTFAAQVPEPQSDVSEPGANKAPCASACIVNIIDQRVWKLTPEFMSYTIAKAGLWTLTQTAAQALAPAIRVNAIGPGPTIANPRQSPEHFARQRAGTILGRGSTPEDICAGVKYILSADAMTGQMLALDGGQHLTWRTPDIVGVGD